MSLLCVYVCDVSVFSFSMDLAQYSHVFFFVLCFLFIKMEEKIEKWVRKTLRRFVFLTNLKDSVFGN